MFVPLSSPNSNSLLAGKISREVRGEVESHDWVGKSYFELCNFVEGLIVKKGGLPAFPTNICANESAAHYTAEIDDSKTVMDGSLLKVDIGTHIEGYVADTAITLCYNDELLDLAEATKSALNEALKVVRRDGKISEVGRAVESYALRRGYIPISNLSGHSLEQYEVHSGVSVPNVISKSPSVFRDDIIYAIEPFLTLLNGSGLVVEGATENIFSIVARKKTKDQKLNDLLELIWNKCRSLPFAARWFSQYYSKVELENMLNQLLKTKLIRSYPELVEARGQPVAQAEHTVAFDPKGLSILT